VNGLMHYGAAAPSAALDGVLKSLEGNLRSMVMQAKQILQSSGADDSGTSDGLDQSIQNLDVIRVQVMTGQAALDQWRSGLIAIANETEALIKQLVDQQMAPGTLLNAIQSFKSQIDAALSRAGSAMPGGGGPSLGMILGVLGIAGLGWWAYSSMKKDAKRRPQFADPDSLDEPESALDDWQDEDDYLQLGSHSRRRRPERCRR